MSPTRRQIIAAAAGAVALAIPVMSGDVVKAEFRAAIEFRHVSICIATGDDTMHLLQGFSKGRETAMVIALPGEDGPTSSTFRRVPDSISDEIAGHLDAIIVAGWGAYDVLSGKEASE